ncbi:MAG: hypothetical protein IPP17_31310 [Bacteroidetes bacterium]|nr:hypothetical protein [Bacteroidota bacterium]
MRTIGAMAKIQSLMAMKKIAAIWNVHHSWISISVPKTSLFAAWCWSMNQVDIVLCSHSSSDIDVSGYIIAVHKRPIEIFSHRVEDKTIIAARRSLKIEVPFLDFPFRKMETEGRISPTTYSATMEMLHKFNMRRVNDRSPWCFDSKRDRRRLPCWQENTTKAKVHRPHQQIRHRIRGASERCPLYRYFFPTRVSMDFHRRKSRNNVEVGMPEQRK